MFNLVLWKVWKINRNVHACVGFSADKINKIIHEIIYSLYLQWTVITAETSAEPMEFTAIHLYSVPSSSLVKFSKCRVSEVDKVSLSLTFIQVIIGCRLPVAWQNSEALLPSMTEVLNGACRISGTTLRKMFLSKAFKIT